MAENEKKAVATEDEAKAVSQKEEKKPAKKDKVSLGQKLGKFFREFKSEMKKIVWFSRKQTINSTILVVVSILISSLVISILDYAFSSAIMALGKLI